MGLTDWTGGWYFPKLVLRNWQREQELAGTPYSQRRCWQEGLLPVIQGICEFSWGCPFDIPEDGGLTSQ